MHFFLGTTNPFKVAEIASILRPIWIGLGVTASVNPEEVGATFQENAAIKAAAYSRHVGATLADRMAQSRGCSVDDARTYLRMRRIWTISEDSGVVVSALDGLPGPRSAQFDDCILDGNRIIEVRPSGRSRNEIDAANNRRVLEMMRAIEQPFRSAAFMICLVVADIDGNALFSTTGESHGWIADEARGDRGFGYDPIFISGDSYGHTWAEIDSMRKNLISHRRKALESFTSWLARQIADDDEDFHVG